MNNKISPLKHNGFFSFLIEYFKNLSFGKKVYEIFTFFKKYFFLGRIIKYVRLFIIWLETSAFVVFFASALIFLLPILSVLILLIFFISCVRHRKHNSLFSDLIASNDFYISFSPTLPKTPIENERENKITMVVITTPTALLPRAVKKISNSCYLISISYYYCLRKHILVKNIDKIKYEKEAEK